MNGLFSSPQEFLQFIILRCSDSADDILDDESISNRRDEILAALKDYNQENPSSILVSTYIEHFQNEFIKPDPTNPSCNPVVTSMYDDICQALPASMKEILHKHIAMSSLNTNLINASIHVSPCKNFFAIILNTSLMQLLHKAGKLQIAAEKPDSIVYCNRFPKNEITYVKLKEMRNEFFEYFRKTKRTHGPMVILNEEASNRHFYSLYIQELFVVCHELGHLINGDFHQYALSDVFLSYVENEQHRKEHMADLIGYLFMIRTLENKFSNYSSINSKVGILFILVHLFDLLFMLQDSESDSHPHPIRRVFCITDHYYGSEFTDFIERSYDDLSILSPFNCKDLKFDSAENDIFNIVTAWLDILFKGINK